MRLVLVGAGRTANQLLRAMSGVYLASVIGARRLEGIRLPEFGLETPIDGDPSHPLVVKGLVLPVESIVLDLMSERFDAVKMAGFPYRLDYFADQLGYWRDRIGRLQAPLPVINPGEVVVHIRAGDILRAKHPMYYPLPLDFYETVLSDLGKEPVFVGEVEGDHPYLHSLRSRFPTARFIQGRLADDFELVRRSPVKVISLSTFAFAAAWLGPADSRVIVPLGGHFETRLRPEFNLLPTDDPRFSFRYLPFVERPRQANSPPAELAHLHRRISEQANGYPAHRPRPVPFRELGLEGTGADPMAFTELRGPEAWCAFAASVIDDARPAT